MSSDSPVFSAESEPENSLTRAILEGTENSENENEIENQPENEFQEENEADEVEAEAEENEEDGEAQAEAEAEAEAAGLGEVETSVAAAPQKLKRPPTGYFLFLNENRPKLIAEHPELDRKVALIGKALGDQWKTLTAEQKNDYMERAKILKEEYEQKIKENVNIIKQTK